MTPKTGLSNTRRSRKGRGNSESPLAEGLPAVWLMPSIFCFPQILSVPHGAPGNLGTHRGAAELSHLQGASRVLEPMMSCAWLCPHNLCGVSGMELDAGNAHVDSVVRELTVALLGLHTRCSGVTSCGPLQVCLHGQSQGLASCCSHNLSVKPWAWARAPAHAFGQTSAGLGIETWKASGTCTMDAAEDRATGRRWELAMVPRTAGQGPLTDDASTHRGGGDGTGPRQSQGRATGRWGKLRNKHRSFS